MLECDEKKRPTIHWRGRKKPRHTVQPLNASGELLKQHELWRKEYRQHRYMEFLSRADLETRTKDILLNMTTLTPAGQIGLHGVNKAGLSWMVKWTHLLEEFGLRYGPYPNGFTDGSMKDVPLVKPTYPKTPASKKAIDSIGGLRDGQLYKFGKFEHLDSMFSKGEIRIAPASYYSDPSLNKAIQDDELSFIVRRISGNLVIKNEYGESISSFGDVQYELKSPTNYYVHCFASNYTYREYDDFEADTCIIISEPRKLFQKMMKAVRTLKPNFKGFASPVTYLDPLTCDPDSVNVFFAKHFKYSYQNEVRTIWLPDKTIDNLEPFFIRVGSMNQYAQIIRI